MHKGLIALIFLTLVSTASLADDSARTCLNTLKSKEMQECEANNAQIITATELKKLEQKLIDRFLTENALEAFIKSNESWEEFVRASCFYETSRWLGGTSATANILACQTKYTKIRADQIKEYLTCPDGGCPE